MGKHSKGPSSPSHLTGSASSSSLSEKGGKEQSKAGRASPTLKQRIQRIWAKLEASLWVLGALFALTYGDGQRNLPAILLHDTRLKRWGCKACWDEAVAGHTLPCYRASGDGLPVSGRLWLYVACVFVTINLLIFLYVRLWWGSYAFLPMSMLTQLSHVFL